MVDIGHRVELPLTKDPLDDDFSKPSFFAEWRQRPGDRGRGVGYGRCRCEFESYVADAKHHLPREGSINTVEVCVLDVEHAVI